MCSSRVRFTLVLMVGLLASIPVGTIHAQDEAAEKKYGQRLIEEFTLPGETIAEYARFKASAPVKGESAIVNALLADTVSWRGPALKLSATANPYTLVLTVTGTAQTDGDLSSLWQVGWELPRGEDDSTEQRLSPVGSIARLGVKAGEPVVLTAPAAPISVREDREIFPAANLVNLKNFSISSVTVQVWSGVPDASWQEVLLSLRWFLVAVVVFALFRWLRPRSR